MRWASVELSSVNQESGEIEYFTGQINIGNEKYLFACNTGDIHILRDLRTADCQAGIRADNIIRYLQPADQ